MLANTTIEHYWKIMLPRKLDFYRKNPKDKYYFAINTWSSRADIYLMGVQNAPSMRLDNRSCSNTGGHTICSTTYDFNSNIILDSSLYQGALYYTEYNCLVDIEFVSWYNDLIKETVDFFTDNKDKFKTNLLQLREGDFVYKKRSKDMFRLNKIYSDTCDLIRVYKSKQARTYSGRKVINVDINSITPVGSYETYMSEIINVMQVLNAACKANYKTYQDYIDAGGTPL